MQTRHAARAAPNVRRIHRAAHPAVRAVESDSNRARRIRIRRAT